MSKWIYNPFADKLRLKQFKASINLTFYNNTGRPLWSGKAWGIDLGITHVLNAAEGKWNNVLTGAEYYNDMAIQYLGVEADDKPTFNISQYFCSTTQFIHEALSDPQSEYSKGQKTIFQSNGL